MNLEIASEGNGEIHLKVLQAICDSDSKESMLDIGCGFAPQTRRLGFKERHYVDIVERDLEEENEFFKHTDIFDLISTKPDKKYDVAINLDCIEHFTKEDGLKIIKWMEDNSVTQIFFTPLGDYMIEPVATNNPDSHKSGWTPEDFQKLGYATINFPNYHQRLNIGAFFAFKSDNLKEKFEYVKTRL